MVRIIPHRLLPSRSHTGSAANSRNASPMRSKSDENGGTGLVLHVVVMKAKGLAAKDRSGTSDPYLVLNVGDSKHVTHTVNKTLDPEWNEQCEFSVNGVADLLVGVCCWDKDRFGKDYLGEIDLALEEVFADNHFEQEPKWFRLNNKRPAKKGNEISGKVLMQFTLYDTNNREASNADIYAKFVGLAKTAPEAESLSRQVSQTPPAPAPATAGSAAPVSTPGKAVPSALPGLPRQPSQGSDDDNYEIFDEDAAEEGDPTQPETAEKRKRRLRIKGLKRKKRDNPYEFSNAGDSDVVGVIYLEISNITDLPPQRNMTKTGFDMDPFVVTSLGKKTYRTKVIRHNLNPVYNEKMLFQIASHEQQYSFVYTVIDRDHYSGNDFIAATQLPLRDLIDKAPKANPETGLYPVRDAEEYVPQQRSRFKRLGLSRSSSAQSLSKQGRPGASRNPSTIGGTPASSQVPSLTQTTSNLSTVTSGDETPTETTQGSVPDPSRLAPVDAEKATANAGQDLTPETDDPEFVPMQLPLKMKDQEKWEGKHNPTLYLRAKYVPYEALRQQFWRSMLRQYDTDDNGTISKVELTTMLDTLGSTLRDSTIDSFFKRFPHKSQEGELNDLTVDEAVICLEDQLQGKTKPATGVRDKIRDMLPDALTKTPIAGSGQGKATIDAPSGDTKAHSMNVPEHGEQGAQGDVLDKSDDLNDDGSGEEHVVEIRECPICHQPRLNKRTDADIITHIATCASQDWRQVNTLMMGGFVTSSQAQRKWYSKVITKIGYGGYKLGANSANILVQDRITGQINEEKMSVYVRLGIRLLYKGLKSRDMETKRIRKMLKDLSIKQGKKYDDPASKAEIPKFIEFHHLDTQEIRRPLEDFANFNEFFYRQLKEDARPCSAPDNPHIIVSPADCRSVVFNQVDQATKVWIKGREFSIKRLLGNTYPEDVSRYENGGALGIFRLAPQDYHRFHIPVDGVLGEAKTIPGEYYTVNPMAIRSALDVYGENIRVIVPIDSEAHGRVMFICIGAMMVGSTVITRKTGDHVKRAEELGYFKFGGSTVILLFEPGKMKFDEDLTDNSNSALETLIRVGMSVGHSPDTPQWVPDMRKDEKEITEEDKQDALRRIQGSFQPADSLDDSDDSPPPPSKVVQSTM